MMLLRVAASPEAVRYQDVRGKSLVVDAGTTLMTHSHAKSNNLVLQQLPRIGGGRGGGEVL